MIMFFRPIKSVLTFVLALVLVSCSNESPSLKWQRAKGFHFAAVNPESVSGPRFQLISAKHTGIDFSNHLLDDQIAANRVLNNGSGVAVADIDGDGLQDIYFTRLHGSNVLYRNLGGFRFEDVTEKAGVACDGQFSTGATFADLDADGDADLLVTAIGSPNRLFLNDGYGRFTDASQESGFDSPSGSTSLAVADLDGDHDLDIFLANYKTVSIYDSLPATQLGFKNVVIKDGDTYRVNPKFAAHFDVVLRDQRVYWFEKGQANQIYWNDGSGRFRMQYVGGEAFLDENGQPTPIFRDWSLAVRAHDVDGDGDQDIYVCNDFESPDRFWLNDGSGRFRLVPGPAIRSTSQSSMAVDFADIDLDGDTDIMLVDMLSRKRSRRLVQRSTVLPEAAKPGEFLNRPQIMQNTLFLNRGDGTFAETARRAGVAATEWSWSVLFMDADLDGYEDMLVTTGHNYDVQDSDAQNMIRMRLSAKALDPARVILHYPPLQTPNFIFRNLTDGRFEEVSAQWGFSGDDISHGMALADLDLDGDLDVIINRLDRPAALYRNTSAEGRVAVQLVGRSPNTSAVGARVVLAGNSMNQVRQISAGGAYLSGSEPIAVFALPEKGPYTLRIDWPDRTVSEIAAIEPNRIYRVFQDSVASVPGPRSPDEQPGPMFVEQADKLQHVHHEQPFDDFARQPLLSRKLSQAGPAVAWVDYDGDGDDDILLSSGAGGRPALFENLSGRGFRPVLRRNMPSFSDDGGGVLAVRMPELRLLLAEGQYEQEHRGTIHQLTPATGARLSFADAGMQLGAMTTADYDGDGDLDLFVAGKVRSGVYPQPASGLFFRNEAGKFIPDPARSKIVDGIGLINSAMFSDLDDDGDPDLVLAIEWGAVRILLNEKDGFRDATADYGLDAFVGWWQGISAGDFDRDGRLDIVATNFGDNSYFTLDGNTTFSVFHGDFDGNGSYDLLEAVPDPQSGELLPFRPLQDIGKALPFVPRKYRSFKEYSRSTAKNILGSRIRYAEHLQVNEFRSMVFLNRGDRFEARPLPDIAQQAPAFSPVVADFDGDGNEDIFLSQNFFAYPIGFPRDDAGRGLLLTGDGAGRFHPVPGQRSGLMIYGEQRGAAAADFDRDGRTDLLVTQNGAATKLFRNVEAKPGVRVRLIGSRKNPDAIGAKVRIVFENGEKGTVREIRAGEGYWSQNAAAAVLGFVDTPQAIEIRWPDGALQTVPFDGSRHEIEIRKGR